MGVAEMHPLVSEGAKAKPALSAQPDSLKMPAWPAWPGAVMLQQATAQSLRSRLRATHPVGAPPPPTPPPPPNLDIGARCLVRCAAAS